MQSRVAALCTGPDALAHDKGVSRVCDYVARNSVAFTHPAGSLLAP